MSNYFEAVFATYGIPDEQGNVLTRQAAERMAAQAKERTISYYPQETKLSNGAVFIQPVVEGMIPGRYRIVETWREGDEQQGRIIARSERISD